MGNNSAMMKSTNSKFPHQIAIPIIWQWIIIHTQWQNYQRRCICMEWKSFFL